MSTLIIHPKDKTTDFLKPIYAPIHNKNVITGGINKTKLKKLIEIHDRIIMLGHGTPWGLLSVGQFPKSGNYIIDYSIVELLSNMKDNIFIWCNADQFVIKNQLKGFYSGMFISELEEGFYYNFWDVEQKTIDDSNNRFAEIVSNYINESLDVLYENVIQEYGVLAETNLIAEFNLERLYLNYDIKRIRSICNTKFT
jgi:hypothetical protein